MAPAVKRILFIIVSTFVAVYLMFIRNSGYLFEFLDNVPEVILLQSEV